MRFNNPFKTSTNMNYRNLLAVGVLSASLLCVCCKNKTATTDTADASAASAVPAVILDTDITSSTDDVVTMVALYNLMDKGLIDLKAVMVNRLGEMNPKFADIMNTYYGHPDIPIGMVYHGAENPKVFIDYGKTAEPEKYEGEPTFARTLSNEQIAQLPDAAKLYRKILSESPDSSVYILSIGFSANLAHLLESEGDEYSPLTGVELVARKVAAIHQQAGHFGKAQEPDYNFNQDKEHAFTYMEKCPAPMYFSPQESGDKFHYNDEDVISDLESVGKQDSPLYHCYTHHEVDATQHMWDIVTLIQMMHPELFEFHGPSDMYVDDNMVLYEGSKSDASNRYYLFPKDDEASKKIMQLIREYVKG